MSTYVGSGERPSCALSLVLWSSQALLGILFTATGVWKLLTPVRELAAMIPWAGEVPAIFLVAIALIDLAGGVGVVLPSLTRIKPGLAVLAALGCAALQVSAVVFHLMRGEAESTPFNVLLVALSLFVAWGRRYRLPIPPRA